MISNQAKTLFAVQLLCVIQQCGEPGSLLFHSICQEHALCPRGCAGVNDGTRARNFDPGDLPIARGCLPQLFDGMRQGFLKGLSPLFAPLVNLIWLWWL